jgi:hypothetical protein
MSLFLPDPFEFFGQAISLQLAIKEFRNELTIDICQNSPRLVVMSIADLERRANEIVASMQAKMEEKRKQELNEPSQHID